MTDSIPFDHQAIRYHCQLLHHFAAGCDGTLVVAAFSADTEENEIRHFPVGQYEAMADFIISFEARPEPINIYTSASVLKLGVSIYSKGKNEDVAAVFAVVVDGDADKDGDSAAMPPVPAHYIVESSPGNRQHYLFLDELIPSDEAAPLLESWHAAVGGDSAAKNLCGLWRCPGTVNHPIESKRKRGRVIAPSSIAQYWNEQRIPSRKLRALLPSPPAPPERRHQDPRIGKVPHYEFLDVVALGLFLDQQGVFEEYGDQEAGWLTFGMACMHDQGEDEERRIWASVHDDTVTAATIKTKLRSFKGDDNPVTLATFMKLAHKKGWTGRLRENLNWTYYFILNGTYQPPEIKPWPEGVPFIGPSPGVWEDHQDEPAPRPHLRTR